MTPRNFQTVRNGKTNLPKTTDSVELGKNRYIHEKWLTVLRLVDNMFGLLLFPNTL